jgi:hypothetical protein
MWTLLPAQLRFAEALLDNVHTVRKLKNVSCAIVHSLYLFSSATLCAGGTRNAAFRKKLRLENERSGRRIKIKLSSEFVQHIARVSMKLLAF